MITCCFLHPNSLLKALPLPFGLQNCGSPPLSSSSLYSGFPSHTRFFPILKHLKLEERGNKTNCHLNAVHNSQELNGAPGEVVDDDEDDAELCPVDCVREFKTEEEFRRILDKAKESGSLVVVDFYRTSCGSCKYIEQGFAKLCKGSGDREAGVVFLKHNVIDEYDEQSEVAERLRIKAVPLFHFYKDGVLLEAFPTRDKERIVSAIRKYTSPL